MINIYLKSDRLLNIGISVHFTIKVYSQVLGWFFPGLVLQTLVIMYQIVVAP